MKDISLSLEVLKKIKKIKENDIKLYKKIKKQLTLFQKDPIHGSLRTHKLTVKLKNVWSISIDKNLRMVYEQTDEYYFIDMGTHDEVYRK